MDLKNILSARIGLNEIVEINSYIRNNESRKNELYSLLFDRDETVSYQAAWVFCHFTKTENKWLFDKQNELIDNLLVCNHAGKRRLLLHLLLKQPLKNPPRTDFLDFCMERMFSKQELPGVQTLCIKIAYELCRPIPELLNFYIQTLELMVPDLLPPSLIAVRKNVFDAIKKGKSLKKTV